MQRQGDAGPWRNGRWLNLFIGAVIAVLVLLAAILTASVLFPDLGAAAMLWILGGGSATALIGWFALRLFGGGSDGAVDGADRAEWRMPPLHALAPTVLGRGEKVWLAILRLYLVVAGGLVLVRIVHLTLAHRS